MLNILKEKEVNMLSGNITKGLVALALPIMAMNVLNSLFNIIDMTMLEKFGSDPNAVGAVGWALSLVTLLFLFPTAKRLSKNFEAQKSAVTE